MTGRTLPAVFKGTLAALALALCLFGHSLGFLAQNPFSPLIRSTIALFRDASVQWMIFLCLGIYFATFLILQSRRGSAAAVRLGSPDFWLTGALLIGGLVYVLDYGTASESAAALVFFAGAVLGKGMSILLRWSKAKSLSERWADLVPTLLIIFLGLASFCHLDTSSNFEYRGTSRESGPWDNPNTYGLLMGVAAVLAAGLCLQVAEGRAPDQKHSSAGGWNSMVGKCLKGLLVVLFLGACFGIGRGLLRSYSRGAWLATVCGLGYLGVQWFQISRFGPEATRDEPLEKQKAKPDGTFARWCRSGLSWLGKNWFGLGVVLVASAILVFWHFRQTEWRPVRRALSVGNRNDFSWRNRIAAWEGAFRMMAEKPVTGFGWNRTDRVYDYYYRVPSVQEAAAIQMNDYLTLGTAIGVPALFCVAAYLWGSLRRRKSEGGARRAEDGSRTELRLAACRAGAIVLLIGFWFDGGLFKLSTAAPFWILLELGRGGGFRIEDGG